MKHLKKFEGFNSEYGELDKIKDFIEETYPTADVNIYGSGIEVEKSDTEPEHGSFCDKTYVTIIAPKLEGQYKISINGISGQYGSDEPEEDDMDIEPEFDWTVGASKIKANASVPTIEDVMKFIKNELDEYLK